MEIFHKFERRLNNSDNSLSETIKTYDKFCNIIKNNKIIHEVHEEILEIISKAYHSYDDLKNNLEYICKLETNNEEEKQLLYESINNDIIEKIYLFHRKIELKNLMKTFEKFIKILGLHETFNQDCDKLRNILSGNNLLNNYEEMKNILSKWDINLLNQKQDYENILNELFTKEQLMIFIKDKKEEDINSLQKLISITKFNYY